MPLGSGLDPRLAKKNIFETKLLKAIIIWIVQDNLGIIILRNISYSYISPLVTDQI